MAEQIDSNKIAENASAPQSVTIDGQTVSQHSITDQIKADRYRRTVAAAKCNPAALINRVRIVPPGTV